MGQELVSMRIYAAMALGYDEHWEGGCRHWAGMMGR
jgi:hypothetical protein